MATSAAKSTTRDAESAEKQPLDQCSIDGRENDHLCSRAGEQGFQALSTSETRESRYARESLESRDARESRDSRESLDPGVESTPGTRAAAASSAGSSAAGVRTDGGHSTGRRNAVRGDAAKDLARVVQERSTSE